MFDEEDAEERKTEDTNKIILENKKNIKIAEKRRVSQMEMINEKVMLE